MSLSNILAIIAAEGGLILSDDSQRNLTIKRINIAAEELYNHDDLVGSLREQIFDTKVDQGIQVTLPSYVGKIRAVRYYFPQMNLKVVDLRSRYQPRFWQSKNFLSWRLKDEVALKRDITNESPLTLSFRKPLESSCNVTIIGSTEDAESISEIIRFNKNDQTNTTVTSFTNITSIAKSVATNSDCDVTDVDGTELAVIANNQLKSLYQRVQIMNPPNNTSGGSTLCFQPIANYVEVLWKLRFNPFVNMEDEFCAPYYDMAIYWNYKKHEMLRQSPIDLAGAQAYEAMANKIVTDVANEVDQNTEKFMNFGPNPIFEAFDYIASNSFTNTNSMTGGGEIIWP